MKESFTPNELKAIWIHYGNARDAAKKLGIGTGTLIENANCDLKGRQRKCKLATTERIRKKYNQLSPKTKAKIQKHAKDLDTLDEHPNVVKALLQVKPKDRGKFLEKFESYKKKTRDEYIAWRGVLRQMYHRYNWKMGKFSK